MKCRLIVLLSFCLPLFCFAQKNTATIKGVVIDEDDKPIQGVSVQVLTKDKGTSTNANGNFTLVVPAKKLIAVTFTAVGFGDFQQNFNLNVGEVETVTIRLKKYSKQLDEVTVKTDADRRQSGAIAIDPNKTLMNPSPNNSIESLLKFFVGSNSELTSNYSVRGGSYDENLIYVNDFEVYRPYLIRNGQQEGLSFINPELTSNVKFYVGGFQAKYGDKMSSVLDITYKKPKKFGGSAYVGILEQGLHLEGITKNNKLSYLVGVRNRSNRNLLSSQQTKGNYVPSSSDVQAVLNYTFNDKWNAEIFANFSATKFTLIPEEAKLTTSVFTPVFSANLGLDIYFEGQEKDAYNTKFVGFAATHQPKKNIRYKWLLSAFNNTESENVDILGVYLFGERNFDQSQSTFGLITNPLGAGAFQNYNRNKLDVTVLSAQQKVFIDSKKHKIQLGLGVDHQIIKDKINEWEYNDSAGYSLPYNPSTLSLNKVVKGSSDIAITRISGYVQDNIIFKDSNGVVLNAGVRYNYNTLNNELLISPRVGISFKPKNWEKNVIFKASAGAYHQPPFYREMRKPDGSVNTNLKAQQSWQLSAGFDYNFKFKDNRPARITGEAYYKTLSQVVPYDIDNVRVRYFGENQAKAYAYGLETRLYADVVKDAESWLSIGFMRTKENIDGFTYKNYYNKNGELITANTQDQTIVDSTINNVGWIRRPTDRMITLGLFFQDYLSTNKNVKMYFSGLYGSNLPYNIPNSVKYRNALVIEPYIRVDIGFAAQLLSAEKQRRSHSPFRNFESIWASLEIFNVIDRQNIISFLMIKDFANNTFAIPNRLTPRMINLKLVARW